MRFSYILWGLLAGLIGAVAAGFILWGIWLLPSLGLLITRNSLFYGIYSILFIGTLGGGIYALILGHRKLRLGATVLSGFILGALLWVAGVLILVPIALGFPPQIGSPMDHWMPLVAFVFYGVVVSLLYTRWSLGQSQKRLHYALAILIVSGLLTPVLLRGAMSTDPKALELPEGYQAEVVAKGFTYPTSILLDEEREVIYVAESGFAYGPKTTTARILKINQEGNTEELSGGFEGPINGLALKDNCLYVSHRGKITELNLETKEKEHLVENLPSLGDHQNNDLIFGEDGALYIGQGSATNTGVVGSDNFIYAWADRFPDYHDIPSRDFTLTGENYQSLALDSVPLTDTETTGAFAPFGQTRATGEQVEKAVPASAAIHRVDLENGEITVYADGLRNPYGLALGPQGELYASNLGYDDRGVRAVKGSPDWIVQIKKGAWYGWPDYAGTVLLDNPEFASERGKNLNPLLEEHPEVEAPLSILPPHYSPMKMDYSPEMFPDQGLFAAIFGDAQPLTEDLEGEIVPTGVIKVDPECGEYSWFVYNREKSRDGRLGHGFKRIIDVKFDEKGEAMYILDFGVMEFTDLAPNAIPNTGVLWKVYPKQS